MKKIFVVGTGGIGITTEIQNRVHAESNQQIEIVVIENEKFQLPIMQDPVIDLKEIIIEKPFVLRKRHIKKGHERPYKFHR